MSDTKAYCYMLNKNPDYDYVKCCVPTLISKKLIFFGPCKKSLRGKLFSEHRKKLVREGQGPLDFEEKEQYVVAFNSSNSIKPKNKEIKGTRKIVWAGKINKLMTFERAYNYFKHNDMDPSFFSDRCSPIHVKPIKKNGEFIGYEFRKNLHREQYYNKSKKQYLENVFNWHCDITSINPNKINNECEIENSQFKLLINPKKRDIIFDRDCCFLCKKISFAYGNGEGIDITPEIFDCIKEGMKQHPKDRKYIDSMDTYAIFGKTKNGSGSANGKTGSYLEITGVPADELIKNIKEEADSIPDITEAQFQNYKNRFKDCCKKRC